MQLVSLILIYLIVIYSVDSAIQLLNNWVQAPVVQTIDGAIHQRNHFPADKAIGFPNIYPLDSDLSSGQRYPMFEQLEPGG